jgi:hypothetical protein
MKEYLGADVWADSCDKNLRLSACGDVIHLSPAVFKALVEFAEKLADAGLFYIEPPRDEVDCPSDFTKGTWD